MKIVVVTGLSGSGKSAALHALEDIGYYSVDNLPLPLLPRLVALIHQTQETDRAALVVDARSGEFIQDHHSIFESLRENGHSVEVLFLEASNKVLLRRFSETRRRHPLAENDVIAGIKAEKKLLEDLREEAKEIINTGELNPHDLKRLIWDRYGEQRSEMSITLLSFGFKHGAPVEANIVFDVRFLPNPYFDPQLGNLPGTDARVAKYVLEQQETKGFLEHAKALLTYLVPLYAKEGKTYLTIAVGCTGGRHRSVAVTEQLQKQLSAEGVNASVRHRDIGITPKIAVNRKSI